jgi:hypothetical protein
MEHDYVAKEQGPQNVPSSSLGSEALFQPDQQDYGAKANESDAKVVRSWDQENPGGNA